MGGFPRGGDAPGRVPGARAMGLLEAGRSPKAEDRGARARFRFPVGDDRAGVLGNWALAKCRDSGAGRGVGEGPGFGGVCGISRISRLRTWFL